MDFDISLSIDKYLSTDTLLTRKSQVLYSGSGTSAVWEQLKDYALSLEQANFNYQALGPNCNSLPSSLLAAMGIDVFSLYYSLHGGTDNKFFDPFVGHNSLLSGASAVTMKGFSGNDDFYDQGGNDTFIGESTQVLVNTDAGDGFDAIYYDYAPRPSNDNALYRQVAA
jgi:Ca2+-binding RTX toxin-like protein